MKVKTYNKGKFKTEIFLSFILLLLIQKTVKIISNSYDLTVDINVQPDAMTGVVMDVTQLVYKYMPSLAYQTSLEE